jgi:hypothetical protein
LKGRVSVWPLVCEAAKRMTLLVAPSANAQRNANFKPKRLRG